MHKQGRTPAPRHQAIGEKKTSEIQQLSHMVLTAQFTNAEFNDFSGIFGGDIAGATNSKVIMTIFINRMNYRAFPQKGFDDQRCFRIAMIVELNLLTQQRIFYVMEMSNKKCRVCPGTLGDEFDDFSDTAAPFNQNNITRSNFIA